MSETMDRPNGADGGESNSHEMRAILAAIVESSDDAIIGKTVGGIISTWNQGAQRMFGYSPEEAIGKSIFLIIPLGQQHEEIEIQKRLALGERVDHFETVRIAKDGGRIDVSVTVSPIKNLKGEIIGASKIARDITAKRRTEADLARHARELARSNLELEHFAYVTSHDLQEPLRTLHSFAQLLEQKCGASLDEEARVHLGFIVGGVKRMQSLITDLLSYCRISTTGLPYTSCDCNKLCETLVEGLKATIELHGAKITISPLPTVICDAAQLGRVFQNLLVNAIKFHGPQAPVVHVFSTESAEEWIFSVSDRGIGISPEFFERIFIIFQRLHTIEEFGGTGIGLATCKKIVERHGGRIWLESELGKGSTFHFSIPKRPQHVK
jgi:PAS domain S-box-containing protein